MTLGNHQCRPCGTTMHGFSHSKGRICTRLRRGGAVRWPADLHVGIDGYNLAMPQGTGVASYARTLATTAAQLGCKIDLLYGVPMAADSPQELRETLFYGRLSEMAPGGQKANASLLARARRLFLTPETREMTEIPVTGRVITQGFEERVPPFDRLLTRGNMFDVSARYFRRFKRFMPLRMKHPPAIMHWTYPLPLRLIGAANIYTIHDLVPLRLPHTSLEDKRYYSSLIAQCVETAAHIVTVSEASRRDILEIFGPEPARITNTYQSCDLISGGLVSDDGNLSRTLGRLFDLKRDGYMLFFGAIEPKKNVGRLIEAYLRSEIETPLVIVGGGGWKSEQELRLLRGGSGIDLPGARQIRQIEYLPRRLLIDLVQGARAVLFPSLYEGFGLPALEAISLGAPLLTSRTSSLPEVAGDAALYVDPYDVAGIVVALKRLDGDGALRETLRRSGPGQAARFSVSAYSERLKSLYSQVLDEFGGG